MIILNDNNNFFEDNRPGNAGKAYKIFGRPIPHFSEFYVENFEIDDSAAEDGSGEIVWKSTGKGWMTISEVQKLTGEKEIYFADEVVTGKNGKIYDAQFVEQQMEGADYELFKKFKMSVPGGDTQKVFEAYCKEYTEKTGEDFEEQEL